MTVPAVVLLRDDQAGLEQLMEIGREADEFEAAWSSLSSSLLWFHPQADDQVILVMFKESAPKCGCLLCQFTRVWEKPVFLRPCLHGGTKRLGWLKSTAS